MGSRTPELQLRNILEGNIEDDVREAVESKVMCHVFQANLEGHKREDFFRDRFNSDTYSFTYIYLLICSRHSHVANIQKIYL